MNPETMNPDTIKPETMEPEIMDPETMILEIGWNEFIDSKGKLLYWQPPNVKNHINSKYILGMDLDWTIIRPIKGKIFPIDINDWQFLDETHIIKIKNKILEGWKFVIFTNQAGIIKGKSGQLTLEQFKTRWYNIYIQLSNHHKIESVYLLIALYDDFYRKPMTGMWEFVEKKLNGNIKVDREKSLYIGDMAGRKNDHSYSDLQFAINLEVPFEVPEVFYNPTSINGKLISNKTTKLMENLKKDDKIFHPKKYIESLDQANIHTHNLEIAHVIKDILDSDIQPVMIIYIGSPASGKSSFLDIYLGTKWKHSIISTGKITYMSLDKFEGTPAKFTKEIGKLCNEGHNIIIDNTNGSIATRRKFIEKARENANNNKYKILGLYFDTSKNVVLHLNEIRNKIYNVCQIQKDYKDSSLSRECITEHIHQHIPNVAIHTYWKKFEIPETKEGFDEIYKINFEPNLDNKYFQYYS